MNAFVIVLALYVSGLGKGLAATAAFVFSGQVFWPYFSGIALFLIGLAVALTRGELTQARRLDKAIVFGRLFLAAPMAVFAADHFVFAQSVSQIVPPWMPGHMFWTYFVGVALIAAALSIMVNRYAVLSSTLLGLMILSFILLIHIRAVVLVRNRFFLAILLRDLSFSGGALAFALAQAGQATANARRMLVVVRCMIGIPAVVFGVEHFLHPEFVPVIPLNRVVPDWIPGHVPLAYVTGVVLIACGISFMVNWNVRLVATWLGIFVFGVVMWVYLPLLLAAPGSIANGLNYFADTLVFAGAALTLAEAMPKEQAAVLPVEVRAAQQSEVA